MAKYNESAAAFVSVLFHSATVTHFMHLQTKSFAQHMALGEYYDAIVELADKWAEAIASLMTGTPYKANAKDGDGDGKVQDGTPHERPVKETRVTKPTETR